MSKKEKYTQEFIQELLSKDTNYSKKGSKYESDKFIGENPFGNLQILQFISTNYLAGINYPSYICKCSCGKLSIAKCNHVINGTIKSCGNCIRSKYTNDDWIGLELNNMKVISTKYTNQVIFVTRDYTI